MGNSMVLVMIWRVVSVDKSISVFCENGCQIHITRCAVENEFVEVGGTP